MPPSLYETLLSQSEKPAGFHKQPFMSQLAELRRNGTDRGALEQASDWIDRNKKRFAVVEGKSPHAPDYRLISAPDNGTVVGIVLETQHNHGLRDTYLIFTAAFDGELAAATGQLPKHLRETLNAGRYLRSEKGRFTCSIPEGLNAMVPVASGSSARRALGVRSRLLSDYPPIYAA